MTKVTIFRNQKGYIHKFVIADHAGAGQEGQDVPCAVVSTASQYAILGLEEVLHLEGFTYAIMDGYLECELSQGLSPEEEEKANILLQTMALVLRQAADQFSEHITMQETTLREV